MPLYRLRVLIFMEKKVRKALIKYSEHDKYIEISDCDESAVKVDIPSEIDGAPVKVIGQAAFFKCSSLASVTIPDTVEMIEGSAFAYCSSLSSIEIPEGLVRLDYSSFFDCSALTSVTLPESLRYIGDNAFLWCTNLESVTIKNPECKINGAWTIGKLSDRDFSGMINCFANSTAQAFAEENGYKFKGYSSGDLDADGEINALDASLVLMEYAAKATGKDTTFNDIQGMVADVNKDGAIDALDASDILRYYAFIATGGSGSLAEYLNK